MLASPQSLSVLNAQPAFTEGDPPPSQKVERVKVTTEETLYEPPNICVLLRINIYIGFPGVGVDDFSTCFGDRSIYSSFFKMDRFLSIWMN